MPEGSRAGRGLLLGIIAWCSILAPGCATMRAHAPHPDLRPCTDGYATTTDGWKLGIRRFDPPNPDPGKLPVVLCHGLGLNGTFWTISGDGNHLPNQLMARGYRVYVVDMRGSGASHRVGTIGKINKVLRETPFNELRDGKWTMDDQARYDVPAIVDYIRRETGAERVNWVGHSLGGMLMIAHLETTDRPDRIASFVDMGGVAVVAPSQSRTDMLRANRGLCVLLSFISTGRIARPMMWRQLPGLERIDQFYYTKANVDPETIGRFYGYTLENPGKGALRQLDSYLDTGHMRSADGQLDYAEHLDRVKVPTLMVAGDKDVMADIASSLMTFEGLGGLDKTFMRFGRRDGHVDDYGHCDLVWSRHAPNEIFPPLIDWLDRRQPGAAPGFGWYDRPLPSKQ
jgi:lysosomal acid lipase/cholesteryl ester hydrolase